MPYLISSSLTVPLHDFPCTPVRSLPSPCRRLWLHDISLILCLLSFSLCHFPFLYFFFNISPSLFRPLHFTPPVLSHPPTLLLLHYFPLTLASSIFLCLNTISLLPPILTFLLPYSSIFLCAIHHFFTSSYVNISPSLLRPLHLPPSPPLMPFHPPSSPLAYTVKR